MDEEADEDEKDEEDDEEADAPIARSSISTLFLLPPPAPSSLNGS